MDIMDAYRAIKSSAIERAAVRPYWNHKTVVINKGVLWAKEELGHDGWTLQRNLLQPRIIRLVQEDTGRFLGWSLDEDFIRHELFPMHTKPSGFVNLQINSINRPIKLAHLSDLHTCWRKHETLEGREVPQRALADLQNSLVTQQPDVICITGDLTDNGLGYMRIYEALKTWFEAGKVLVVPGNHDLNRLGLTSMASAYKDEDWCAFSRVAMGDGFDRTFAFRSGALLIAGIDSSGSDWNTAIVDNARGHVRHEDLRDLEERIRRLDGDTPASHRVFMVHHHLEVPPVSTLEHGMMDTALLHAIHLGNSIDVLDFCRKTDMKLTLHGHKHVSYAIESEGVNGMKIFSTPSTTMDRHYYMVHLDRETIWREKVTI